MKIIRQGRSKFVIRAKFIVGHARQTVRQTVRLPDVSKNVEIIAYTYIVNVRQVLYIFDLIKIWVKHD